MTINEAREAIKEWSTNEYNVEPDNEPDDRISIAYCEYEGNGVFVTEQWYANLITKELFCELNDKVCIIRTFKSLEDMVFDIDFEWLVGIADSYVEEHIDSFKEA